LGRRLGGSQSRWGIFLARQGWQTPSLPGAGVDAGNSAAPVDWTVRAVSCFVSLLRRFAEFNLYSKIKKNEVMRHFGFWGLFLYVSVVSIKKRK
jgi:hypothetical protein